MRRGISAALSLLSVLWLAACGDPQPPAGRWQGEYEGTDVMIVARLEIASNGSVRISAPNAFADFTQMEEVQRSDMHGRLLVSLARAWPHVAPVSFAFDGKIFRKPGGVAPQLEWDAQKRQMTMVVYPGMHATIKVPLQPVSDFDDAS